MELIIDILSFNQREPMLFTGMYFWIFYALVLMVYSLVYKKHLLRSAFLFAASLFFYYKSSGFYFWLLIFSTIVDYLIGFRIHNSPTVLKKKLWVTASLFINLGLLGYFKYTYFLADTISGLTGSPFQVENLLAVFSNASFGTSFSIDKIILPVGISFYTFQTISYAIDVYRGRLEPVKSIIDFGFYVSFFPQLVAGPIVRAAEFIPQIQQKYSLTKEQFGHAIFLILNGLVKKMLISDYISINFVDRVFDSPASYTGTENLLAVYGYAIQIYCDFSGYTDIAIGVAILLGFHLPLNFNSPYKAESVTDFWRRWHISLSSWLKDYLYISLGGNRKGKIRTYINLMLTMLLGGLWHGAHLRFIIWGGLHGAALALHKMWASFSPLSEWDNKIYRFFAAAATFHFVCFAWIFFRAPSMDAAWTVIERCIFHLQGEVFGQFINGYPEVFTVLCIGFIAHWLPADWKEISKQKFISWHPSLKLASVLAIAVLVYQAKSADLQAFIYFQF